MVTFGGYALPHVQSVTDQQPRVIVDKLVPQAKVGYRDDITAGGRIIEVTGEIRDDPDYVLRIEEFRLRMDDVARDLDLEDDGTCVNAKLGAVEVVWIVEDGLERPSYSVTFYETS